MKKLIEIDQFRRDPTAPANATRIWETYYRSRPLFADTASWEEWMPEYRRLIIEVQEIWEECRGRGVGLYRDQHHERPA